MRVDIILMRFFLVLLSCLVFFQIRAQKNTSADLPLPKSSKTSDPYKASQLFDVGGSAYWRKYHEYFPNGKSTEYGPLFGGYAKYEYAPKNSLYFQALLDFSLGRTVYDGGIQDGNGNSVPYKGYTDNTLTDLWLKLGYTLEIVPGIASLTPYGGAGGFLWWRGNIGCAGKSCTSYDEYYYWGYWILGLKTEVWFNSKIRVSPEFTYMHMINGKMRIDGINYGNKVANLGNKAHYYAEIQTTYFYKPEVGFSISPFASSRPIGRSNDVYTTGPKGTAVIWHEPASFTYLGGLKAGITYVF